MLFYSTSISPFVSSPKAIAQRLLTLAELKPGEVLYDLGAGDGQIILLAAQEFGAKGVGIEIRKDLTRRTREKIIELNLQNRVKVINKDLFAVDISGADVVYLYLTTSANERVKPKLEDELRKGARVVSHDFEVSGWKPVTVEHFSTAILGFPRHTLYLYKR